MAVSSSPPPFEHGGAHGHEMGDIGDNIVFAGLGPEQAFRERKRSGKSISQNYRLLNPEVASALHRAELDRHRAAAADRRPPCSLLGLSKTAGAGLLDVRGSSFIPVLPARTSAAVLRPLLQWHYFKHYCVRVDVWLSVTLVLNSLIKLVYLLNRQNLTIAYDQCVLPQ